MASRSRNMVCTAGISAAGDPSNASSIWVSSTDHSRLARSPAARRSGSGYSSSFGLGSIG